jgi:hypothetical protein
LSLECHIASGFCCLDFDWTDSFRVCGRKVGSVVGRTMGQTFLVNAPLAFTRLNS